MSMAQLQTTTGDGARPARRWSHRDAEGVLARYRAMPREALGSAFREGRAPRFAEIEGDTAGAIVAFGPAVGALLERVARAPLETPLSRWLGKRFLTPFGSTEPGRGINVFRSHLLPERFPFETRLGPSRLDGKDCLILEYSPRSLLRGTLDEVRWVEPGVLVGRGHYKAPWQRSHRFVAYFVLCALEGPSG